MLKIQTPTILKNEDWKQEHLDANLSECLALTPDPAPTDKKTGIELKTLPEDLRYEFLDK